MAKLIVILLTGLCFEAVGVVFLSKGLKTIGKPDRLTAASVAGMVRDGARNSQLLAGVFFEAVFFACLLVLMSKADVSFIWPLTSLGFVLTTGAARLILRETVDGFRWSGVLLIMLGAALITWSEHEKRAADPVVRINGK